MNYEEKKPMNYEEKPKHQEGKPMHQDKPMHREEKTEKKPNYGAQPEGQKPKEAMPEQKEQKKAPMQGDCESCKKCQ